MYRARLACLLVIGFASSSYSGDDPAIEKHTIDGGSARMSGDGFTVEGTIGQPEAQRLEARGGRYAIEGGYWALTDPTYIFSDGFEE